MTWRAADHLAVEARRAVEIVAGVRQEVGPPTVYVAPLPDGPPYVLEGAGALIWQALPGEEEALVATVAGQAPADLDPDDVRARVLATLADLADLGLVTRHIDPA